MNEMRDQPASLPFAPAAERNAAPILEALRGRLPAGGRVLEIGAGTGQHAVAFTAALPGLRWLPTDLAPALPGLAARVHVEGGSGIEPPRVLDVRSEDWPAGPFDAVYTANTAHIMPWSAVLATLKGVAGVLSPGGLYLVYGPFRRDGRHTADSNARFDAALRDRDPSQGVRDLEALERAAVRHQLVLEEVVALPANNLLAVFRQGITDP